jgi:hypothetical protein
MGAWKADLFNFTGYVRVAPNNTPAIATVGFIDVIGYYLTTTPCGGGLEYLHRSPCES